MSDSEPAFDSFGHRHMDQEARRTCCRPEPHSGRSRYCCELAQGTAFAPQSILAEAGLLARLLGIADADQVTFGVAIVFALPSDSRLRLASKLSALATVG